MGSRATRVDSSHIELRQQLSAAHERIAAMEKELRSVAAPTLPDNTQALALEKAHQQIAELQKQLRASQDQVASTQTELAELRAWGQRANETLGAVADKLKRDNKKIAELEAERAAASSRAAARSPSQPSQTGQSVRAPEPGNRRPQVATDPARPPQVPQTSSQPRVSPPSSPSSASKENASRAPYPWERYSQQTGSPLVPKWIDATASNLSAAREYSRIVLDKIPAQMRAAGYRNDADCMKKYIGVSPQIMQTLSVLLVLRVICTAGEHRQTPDQEQTLARLALEDTVETLMQEGNPCAVIFRQELAGGSRTLFRLALELVRGCRETGL